GSTGGSGPRSRSGSPATIGPTSRCRRWSSVAPPDRGWIRGMVLLAVVACSDPPTAAVLDEVPDLRVITEVVEPAATIQLRLENDAAAGAAFLAPACATTFEQFVGGGWQAIGTPPPCSGIPLTIAAGASFDYV